MRSVVVSGDRPRVWRSRWAAVGAAVAVTLGGGGIFAVQAASSVPSSVVTIDPVRVLDTRDPLNVGLPGPFVSAVSQKLRVTGAVQTTTGTQTPVPVGATGVLLNVTVVVPSADGFLSVRPGDATGTPSTSSLNFKAGAIVPNSVQVGLPTTGDHAGKIDITYDAFGTAGPTTDVLIDVVGYMIPGSGGVPGPAGPAGPPGPAGPAGPVNVRWAKVDADTTGATLLSGSGVTAVGRNSTGVYTVTFDSLATGCGWTATLNDNAGGIATAGEITVEALVSTSEKLWVRTYNSAGTLTDRDDTDGFTLMVICP